MTSKSKRNNLIFGWAGLMAFVLQAYGLYRYINRLPQDWIGISLYVITLLAFGAVSIYGFSRASRGEG